MGKIIAAALLSHQPGIMLPERVRVAAGGGRDTTLVEGFARVRQRLDAVRADTLVIFDTHWLTTMDHVVRGLAHYRGTYTSDELPHLIADHAYDYPGAPDLAAQVEALGQARGVPATVVRSPHMTHHYPTLNVLHYLHRGERVLSVSLCQTARPEDFMAFGGLLAAAVTRVDGRVALLASGGMSHRFHTLKELRRHMAWDCANVSSEENRALDGRILELWRTGDHAAVLELWSEYAGASPEGLFGHYFQLLGALGGTACRARGTPLSEYENALGTGQVHVWFDLDGSSVGLQDQPTGGAG
jgi:3,4-dihydroxyphenylacetate 2,3-dioxygenase